MICIFVQASYADISVGASGFLPDKLSSNLADRLPLVRPEPGSDWDWGVVYITLGQQLMMHSFHLNFISAALLLCAFNLSYAGTSEPTKKEKFEVVSLSSISRLDNTFPSAVVASLQAAIKRDGCPAEEIKLYRSSNTTTKVITISCYPPNNVPLDDRRQNTYISHPLTFVVSNRSAQEVDLSAYTFMYETGHIDAITDIDRNGMPEFWLSGAICECDGDPPPNTQEECDCDSTEVREFKSGRLVNWKRSRKSP